MGGKISPTSYQGKIATTKKTGKNLLPVFGTATLILGTVDINTPFINLESKVLFGRTDENASTALGELVSTNIATGESFSVESIDAAGALETGDLTTFNWMFLQEEQQ